ncbi:MAG: hypothetical protein Q9196_006953, partial [Gyalolechia fulgens]
MAFWVAAQNAQDSEQESVNFWQLVLSKSIFAGDDDIGVTPLATGEGMKVDIVVKHIEPPALRIRRLCVVAVKKPNALIHDVERQAITACTSYLNSNNMSSVYAMTAIGTAARLWKYKKNDDYLTPMFGGDGLSDMNDYIEANSNAAQILLTKFK